MLATKYAIKGYGVDIAEKMITIQRNTAKNLLPALR